MILPIRLFGDPVLRTRTIKVGDVTDEVEALIGNMLDTMRNAAGIGLAAPQVGRTDRIFVIDIGPLLEDLPERERQNVPPQPMVFLNAEIISESEAEEEFEEGCLSIPDIRESVIRPEEIRIEYQNRNMEAQSLRIGGFLSRVIQHEYDHLNGMLFTDHISAFRRNLLRRRLREIARGEVEAAYPIQVAHALK